MLARYIATPTQSESALQQRKSFRMHRLRNAASALLVPSIAAATLVSLLSCSGSGPDGTEAITIRLNSNEDCYGVIVAVATSEAAQTFCNIDPALLAAGCTVDIDKSGNDIELAVHGCFTSDDEPLFTCTLPSSVADEFRDDVEVRCGCGCAEDCPDDPGIAVCDGNGTDCVVSAASERDAAAVAQRSPTSIGRRGVAASSTCGTCCDAQLDSDVRLVSGDGVRELRFEISVESDPGNTCSIDNCSFAPSLTGPNSEEILGEDRRRICIADPSGLDAGQLLVNCSVSTGGGGVIPGNVSALGPDLRPVTPPPALEGTD
jgi:hypothetical protein